MRWQFTFLLLLLFAARARGEEPIGVLVVDTPLKRDLEVFQGRLNNKLMDTLQTQYKGKTLSLNEVNDLMYRMERNPTHGTAVAGTLVRTTVPTSLIHIPLNDEVFYPAKNSLSVIFGSDETIRKKVDQEIDLMERAITEGNVRVVNISMGLANPTTVYYALKEHLGGLANIKSLGRLKQYALRVARIHQEQLQSLMLRHPQTAFVVAAGNAGIPTEQEGISMNLIQAPNLVRVGASYRFPYTPHGPSQMKAGFSTYSPTSVDLAAPGVEVSVPGIYGNDIKVSGTSVSSPQVAKRIAETLYRNPKLSLEEAISQVLVQETHLNPKLEMYFAYGRELFTSGVRVAQESPRIIEIRVDGPLREKNFEPLVLMAKTLLPAQGDYEVRVYSDDIEGKLVVSNGKSESTFSTNMNQKKAAIRRCGETFSILDPKFWRENLSPRLEGF